MNLSRLDFSSWYRVGLLLALAGAGGCAKAATHGEIAYVSNEDSNDLTVIATDDNTVIETIPVGKRPRGDQPATAEALHDLEEPVGAAHRG